MPTSLTSYNVFFQAQFGPNDAGQGTVPAIYSSGNEPSSDLSASGLNATNPLDAMVQANGVGFHGTIIDGTLHGDGGVNEAAPPPGNPGAYNQGGVTFNASFSDALTVSQIVYVTFTPVFEGSDMGLASNGFFFGVSDSASPGYFIDDSVETPAQTFILYPGHTYATTIRLEIGISGLSQEAEASEGSATNFTAGFTVTELNADQDAVPGNPDLSFDSGFKHLDVVAPCFAQGTRIRTYRGDVAVERLRVGELLPTPAGDGSRRIKWIGHRHTDCRRHPRPHDVFPVRVRAEAFGSGMPRRDLLLSPDHAVFVGGDGEGAAPGVLIPIRYLINGATIAQEKVDAVTYWHVELESHDIVLADGLPCESYLDTGNRSTFSNLLRRMPGSGRVVA